MTPDLIISYQVHLLQSQRGILQNTLDVVLNGRITELKSEIDFLKQDLATAKAKPTIDFIEGEIFKLEKQIQGLLCGENFTLEMKESFLAEILENKVIRTIITSLLISIINKEVGVNLEEGTFVTLEMFNKFVKSKANPEFDNISSIPSNLKIKYLRKMLVLTQGETAAKFGLSVETVSNYERGTTHIPLNYLSKLLIAAKEKKYYLSPELVEFIATQVQS